MSDNNYNDFLINLVNVLSFAIGLQNLDLNDKQVMALENHLCKQDEQYDKIIQLLKENNDERKNN